MNKDNLTAPTRKTDRHDYWYELYKQRKTTKEPYISDPEIVDGKALIIVKNLNSRLPYSKDRKLLGLDIGCGDALVTETVCKKIKDQFGIEIVMEYADVIDVRTNKLTPFYQIDKDKLIPTDKVYDIVTCFHMIHHDGNFFPFRMNNICSLLRRNGIFVIKEHDTNSDQMRQIIIEKHLKYEIYEIEPNWDENKFKLWLESYPKQFHLTDLDSMIKKITNYNFTLRHNNKPNYKNDATYIAIFHKN